MFKFNSLDAKNDSVLARGIKKYLALRVFAEEATNPSPASTETTTPTVNFEALIAQARKEEKDKLYPRITKLEGENKVLTENINTYLLQIATLKEELEKMKTDTKDSKKISDLEKTIEKITKEKEDLEKSAPKEADIRANLEAEYSVKLYAQQKFTAEKDNISKTFTPDFSKVAFKTNEEVDAAVKEAIDKTVEIKKELGILDADGKPVKVVTPAKEDKNERPPVVTPSLDTVFTKYSTEDIRKMDPKSKEYAEFRKSTGLK